MTKVSLEHANQAMLAAFIKRIKRASIFMLIAGLGALTFATTSSANTIDNHDQPLTIEQTINRGSAVESMTIRAIKENLGAKVGSGTVHRLNEAGAFSIQGKAGSIDIYHSVLEPGQVLVTDLSKLKQEAGNPVVSVYSGRAHQDIATTPSAQAPQIGAGPPPKEDPYKIKLIRAKIARLWIVGQEASIDAIYDGLNQNHQVTPKLQQMVKAMKKWSFNIRYYVALGNLDLTEYEKMKEFGAEYLKAVRGFVNTTQPWNAMPLNIVPGSGANLKKVNPEVLQRLQIVQYYLSLVGVEPVKITSGYRDYRTNVDAGGAPDSRHLSGDAVDIIPIPSQAGLVAQICTLFGFNVIDEMKDNGHIHIDLRPEQFYRVNPYGPAVENFFLQAKYVGADSLRTVAYRSNQAMITPGGIDLAKTNLQTIAGGGKVQTTFSDPIQLQLLTNADGLIPLIYNVQTMNFPKMNMLLGNP